MKPKSFDSAVKLADQLKHIFVATADSKGRPHIAAAAELSRVSEDTVSVAAWFCPGTVSNLQYNKQISLVVWDPSADNGYQLFGEVEQIQEGSMLNGFGPEIESSAPVPQAERKLRVRVNQVIRFSHAPHSDVED